MKLLTLNIEGQKHLNAITRLLDEQKPDIVSFQEIFKSDLSLVLEVLKKHDHYEHDFLGMTMVKGPNNWKIDPAGEMGLGLFVRAPYVTGEGSIFKQALYDGTEQSLPIFNGPSTFRRGIISARLTVDSQSLAVITTHFTWSPKGQPSAQQQRDVKQLRALLRAYNRYILCGDFNAPRGGDIFRQMSLGLTDHLPGDVVTTLDSEYHYAGVLNLVVDGVLSTPDIHSIRTEVIGGVSDHKAVVVEFAL